MTDFPGCEYFVQHHKSVSLPSVLHDIQHTEEVLGQKESEHLIVSLKLLKLINPTWKGTVSLTLLF